MADVKMADVFWNAALLVEMEGYSCIAVKVAYAELAGCDYPSHWEHPSLNLMRELGCDPSPDYGGGTSSVMDRTPNPDVTRSIWLLLAMHVAEDEGLTV